MLSFCLLAGFAAVVVVVVVVVVAVVVVVVLLLLLLSLSLSSSSSSSSSLFLLCLVIGSVATIVSVAVLILDRRIFAVFSVVEAMAALGIRMQNFLTTAASLNITHVSNRSVTTNHNHPVPLKHHRCDSQPSPLPHTAAPKTTTLTA